ncbi:EamA family transporter [Thermodesulfobacteriota bacterium]
MVGPVYAISAAISYALNSTFIRRASLKVPDASFGTLITVPMAVPYFFLILTLNGQIQSIFSFTWQSYVYLALAGIVHFVVGRSLSYRCVQLVGANIASILRRFSILVAVVIGLSFLREPFSWQLAGGVVLIVTGLTLAGFSPHTIRTSDGRILKIPVKAIMLGLGCGLSWGISPILARLALRESGSPIAGAFISFVAATAVLSVSLLNRKRRASAAYLTGGAAILFFIAGLLSCTANLFRYLALSLAPASVISPLVATSPVFVMIFSFLFNRKLEIFSKQIIIGTITVVIGTILLV